MPLLPNGLDVDELTPDQIKQLMSSYGGGGFEPEFDTSARDVGIGEGGQKIAADRLNKLHMLSSQKYGAKGGIWGRSDIGKSLQPWELEAVRQGTLPSEPSPAPIGPFVGFRGGRGGGEGTFQTGGEAPGQFGFNLGRFADPNVPGSEFATTFGNRAISDEVLGDYTNLLGAKVGIPALGVAGTALGYGASPGAALGYGLKGLGAAAANPTTMAIIAAHTANQAPDIAAMGRSSVNMIDALHGTQVDPGTAEETFEGFLGGRESESATQRALASAGLIDSPGLANEMFMDDIVDITVANAPMAGRLPRSSLQSPVSAILSANQARQAAIEGTVGVHGGIDPVTGGTQMGAPDLVNISSEIGATEAMLPSVVGWSKLKRAKELRGRDDGVGPSEDSYGGYAGGGAGPIGTPGAAGMGGWGDSGGGGDK